MNKVISAISTDGLFQLDYCNHTQNIIEKSFKWQIDVTRSHIFDTSGKGRYILQIVLIENCDNYNFSIKNIKSSTDNIDVSTVDNTIDIQGIGSVAFDIVSKIEANKINNKETKYKIILKKVGTSDIDTQSDEYSFSLTNTNRLCNECRKPHDIGVCKIEPKAIEYIGSGLLNSIEVAELIISPSAVATDNDFIEILYNTSPIPQSDDNVKVKYGDVLYTCYLVLGNTGGETIIKLSAEDEIRIPIVAEGLPVPDDNTTNIDISVDVRYNVCKQDNNCHTVTASASYRKSVKLNKLNVTLFDPEVKSIENIIGHNEINKIFKVTDGMSETKTIKIENEATEAVAANCGIHIRNIKRSIINIEELKGRFEKAEFDPEKEWNIESENSYILHGANNEDISIPGESTATNVKSISIPFIVKYNNLGDIIIKNHSRSVDVRMILEFDYKIDELTIDDVNNSIINSSNNNEYKHYKQELVFTIERSLLKEWHTIDFGTSAVVSIKSTDHWEKQSITDLKSKKERLLVEAYPTDKEKRCDTGEEETKNLIASTIYINPAANTTTPEDESNEQENVEIKRGEEYLKNQLWFSPSTGMINPNYRLPCVKNLIGNNVLPNIPGVDTNTLDVEKVVGTAYEQLCKYYLNDEKIEGLALTVPNSFTPLHKDKIRKIIMNQIDTLADDNLEFISESDAVLWSYIKKTRQRLREFKKELERQQKNKEYILIFDMGAGTLDITYAECSDEIDSNGKVICNIDIKSRIGVNKAGNYIDYLIGEIILKIMGNKGVTPAQWNKFSKTLSTSGANADYKAKKDLREYLRNKVKVMLNNPEMLLPPINPDAPDEEKYKLFNDCENYEILGKIKIKEIIEDELFKKFIESCTTKLMQELAEKQGTKELDSRKSTNKFLLDTVILSGRTTSLPAISQSLKEAFNEYTSTCCDFKLRDVIKTLNNIKEAEKGCILYLEPDTTERKTVVAYGALDYLQLVLHSSGYKITSNKRIYGCYGLLLKHGNDIIDWIPLISEEDYLKKGIHDKDNIYKKGADVNTEDISRILLCHTYNVDPKQEALNNNYDSTTVLHKYDVVGNADIKIEIEITAEREIKYSIRGQYKDLELHDDYGNEALRKSLWPVVYNN